MSKAVANVNVTSDTFQVWVTQTNVLLSSLSNEIVTANSTLGNTVGNCHVNGFLAGNTIVACANIGGGTITANSSLLPQINYANLTFITNTVHTSNTFFNSGVVFTDASVGTHSNTHTFSSNVTFSGPNVILTNGTELLANSVMGTALQVLSSNGSSAYWRSITEMQLVDSVTNTSITYAATANAVATTYALASATTYSTSRVFNANISANGTALIIAPGTSLYANGVSGGAGTVLTSNGTSVYWSPVAATTTVLDSVSNTSTTIAAAANSVTTAYNAAIAANTLANTAATNAINANTRAFSAQTAATTAETDAQNANTRAFSAQTAAVAAYSNATAFAANATNLTSGTVAVARLSGTYSISVTGSAGSVAWTNVTGHPTDLSAFTNGPGYVTSTAPDTAYSNAIAYSSNATNLTSGIVPAARLTGTYFININGSAGSVAWTGVTGAPTDLSSFTNGPGYITSSGRAYPRLSTGGNLDFNYSGQAGTPTWVWGTTDGATWYAFNPANFSVSSASSATSAGSVPWTGVTGRPTDLSSFTNGPGYVTQTAVNTGAATAYSNATAYSSNATNLTSGTVAAARIPANFVQHVTSGYNSGRLFVSSTTPASPLQGDIWFQV